jgi:predicted nucleic acid-binding protein
MIVVDTSVLIDFQRTRDPKLKKLFASLPVAICGATRAEILHGARNPGNRRNLLTFLNSFQQVSIPDNIWDPVGDHLASLRAAGLTIPFPDVVIITVGISNGIEVWARDKHFADVQKVLPALKLFQEPP